MADYRRFERPFEPGLVAEVAALARELFGELDTLEIAWRLDSMPDATLHVAHVNSELVAFKLGYAVGRARYYSWLGGVASPHRAQGIGRALLDRQHAWAKSKGYAAIDTGTTKNNRAMLRLNLSAGFEIIGSYARDALPRVMLQKRFDPS